MNIKNKIAHPYHVLIVDDDKLTLALEQAVLNDHYTTTTAKNGYEALKFLQKNKFDVVLTDIQMPHLDGIGLTKAIRALVNFNQNALVIGLTASDDENLMDECMQVGMNVLMKKPINKQAVLHRVNTYTSIG